MQRSFDPAVGTADVYPQEITRVLLNLISNGFYATAKRKTEAGDGFERTEVFKCRRAGVFFSFSASTHAGIRLWTPKLEPDEPGRADRDSNDQPLPDSGEGDSARRTNFGHGRSSEPGFDCEIIERQKPVDKWERAPRRTENWSKHRTRMRRAG
jgi:hypothetical protein